METERDTLLFQEIAGYIRNSHNKLLKKLLLQRELRSLCAEYRRVSFMDNYFTQALQKDPCCLQLMTAFVKNCGQHFIDWVVLEGSPDMLELFLDFWNTVKDTQYKKEISPRRSPDYHPVNRSIYCGRTDNVPLLLRYGLGLELTESFYTRLQKSVLNYLVSPTQRTAWLRRIKGLPNQKRVFLVLLVIRTYNYSEKFPRFYKGADKALQMIWRSIPDSPLCRNEIVDIFADFDANFDKLEEIMEHYEKFICDDDFTVLGQPRSLAHYSRCKIRQVLRFNKELPTGVDKLLLPMRLKSYLLLE